MYNINNEKTKNKIKEEKRKFEDWKNERGLQDDPFAEERYLAREKGVIWFDNEKVGHSKIIVRKPEEYTDWCEKFEAMKALQRQKEYAKRQEDIANLGKEEVEKRERQERKKRLEKMKEEILTKK